MLEDEYSIELAHKLLDYYGVPREIPTVNRPMQLAGRISYMKNVAIAIMPNREQIVVFEDPNTSRVTREIKAPPIEIGEAILDNRRINLERDFKVDL